MTATHELHWPIENATGEPPSAADLTVAGSNILLDLHGDPTRARLVVFSDGNHHMALEESLRAFLRTCPDCQDIFYATTPPRIIVEALKSGVLSSGNLRLQCRAHVFVSPEDVLEKLHRQGLVARPTPFMRSDGLALLYRRENPAEIDSPQDLLRTDLRLALSNPVTESASFSVYERAVLAVAQRSGEDPEAVRQRLHGDTVPKSRLIHHREIPALIAADRADLSLVYRHLALRYTRIFPELFSHRVIEPALLEAAGCISHYHVALVGDGGPYGRGLLEFLRSDVVADIYRSHALATPESVPADRGEHRARE